MIEAFKVLSSRDPDRKAQELLREVADEHNPRDIDGSLVVGAWAFVQTAPVALPVAAVALVLSGEMLPAVITAVLVEAVGVFCVTRRTRIAGEVFSQIADYHPHDQK